MAESKPSPKTILRGHKVQVHAAAFSRGNGRLVTGDAEGYVVLWDLTIMRARAVWRAHESAILGVRGWGADKLITHGRDNKLIVWKIGQDDEENLSTTLPVESVTTPRPQPWVLHLLEVNTMNFCSFSACSRDPAEPFDGASEEILITVPNTLASEAIDIYTLPSQSRIHTLKPGDGNGMAMCLKIFHSEACLTLIAAFENGYASVHRLEADGNWVMTYRSQPHAQPILSLDLHPEYEYFITSSADSIIAKHPIPAARQEVARQGESTERVVEIIETPSQASSLLSAALKGSSSKVPSSTPGILREWKDPLQVVNTKHSGQQSLAIRSDGRLFATAGWDSKIRVYSAKSLKELAVLKWHQVGCYAVAFADVAVPEVIVSDSAREMEGSSRTEPPSNGTSMVQRGGAGVVSVKDRRIQQAKTAHWVAAGAKDGKVSLWDIY